MISFLLSCAKKESIKNSDSDLIKMNLKGDLRSLSETTIYEGDSPGLRSGILIYHSDYQFDRAGNIIEHKYYYSDSTKWARTTLRYDNSGRLTEKLLFGKDHTVARRETWEYDNEGNLLKKTDAGNPPDVVYTETYSYDNGKKEIEKIISKSRLNKSFVQVYDNQGRVRREKRSQLITGQIIKVLYKLDDNGNRIEEIFFKSDETPGARNVNSYDEKGRKREERHIGSDGRPGTWYTTDYNENGNPVEICSYNEFDSLFYIVRMEYDSNGRLTGRWSGKSESDLSMDKSVTYNENGDILEEINNYGSSYSNTINKYQYDEAGNWVNRITDEISRKTGKRFSVSATTRVLEYY